mgnify:CR=1 FL=1
MQKILIYGAGSGGSRLLEEMRCNSEPYSVMAFIDKRIGGTKKDGLPVIFPDDIQGYDYDLIFVATLDHSVSDMLHEYYNVPREKINHSRYFNSAEISVRIRALERFCDLCHLYNLSGSVAELGVYQGDFAVHINRLFPESTLYLYDTFEGFVKKDVAQEDNEPFVKAYHHYANTTVQLVLGKLPHPDKAVICKGYFPDSAVECKDKYVFVSLDADLYAPTLAGLEFFWPKLVSGGAIFIHDFFSKEFTGAKKAVTEFAHRNQICVSVIGDFVTVAIVKPLFS